MGYVVLMLGRNISNNYFTLSRFLKHFREESEGAATINRRSASATQSGINKDFDQH